jgi:hypothetical protein
MKRVSEALLLTLATVASTFASGVQFRTVDLPRAIKGSSYHAAIDVVGDGNCAEGDIGLSVASGALPRGLQLFNFGVGGTPTEVGHFQVAIRASSMCASGTQTFEILVTARPILEVGPPAVVLEYKAGSGNLQTKNVLVSASWPDLAYSVEVEGAPWLIAEPERGVTPGAGSATTGDIVTLRFDPSQLPVGRHRGWLIVSTWLGANAPRIPVELHISPE